MEASSITGVSIECVDGIVRRASLPCGACGSREWLYYADGTRKVECRGCKRFVGYDLSCKRTGKQGPTIQGPNTSH